METAMTRSIDQIQAARAEATRLAAAPQSALATQIAKAAARDAMLTRDETVHYALAIAREYRKQGLTLTLRQMYYQFVARGLVDNGQASYKRIGAALTDARYDGAYPIDYLEDRGRSVARGDYTRNDLDADRAEREAAAHLRNMPDYMVGRARWFGQPVHVSVWVEKEALAGVFEPTCMRLGVSWFACKGYPSVSALDAWLDETDFALGYGPNAQTAREDPDRQGIGNHRNDERHEPCGAERAVVLYFGDHDPDGWEIPRSAERNLAKLRRVRERDGRGSDPSDYEITFIRVALTMAQIEEHNPPPFDAKVSSSRYAGYVEEHDTDQAWELDALDPTTLRGLIEKHVDQHFDAKILEVSRRLVRFARDEVRERLSVDGWSGRALRREV